MLSLEEHILEAIQRQRGDERVKDDVRVNKLVIEIERVLKEHVEALKGLATQYEADLQTRAKETVTRLLGVAAGLYDKVRGKHPLSRDLRDNYTALSLAAMGYTTFHTYGLAVEEQSIAELAQTHLRDLTPLLVEISKVLPQVTASEVVKESDFPTNADIVEQAVKNTQEAWQPSHVRHTSA